MIKLQISSMQKQLKFYFKIICVCWFLGSSESYFYDIILFIYLFTYY